jgi:predicted phage tail protein
MINGVLAERTVKDVLPALKTNSDGLKQVLDELMKQYKTKQDEMDTWKVYKSLWPTAFLSAREDLQKLTLVFASEEEQCAGRTESITFVRATWYAVLTRS